MTDRLTPDEARAVEASEPGRYPRILDYMRRTPWAIMPSYLVIARDILALRNAGLFLTREQIAERMAFVRQARHDSGNAPGEPARGAGAVAVLSLRGPIGHRMADMEDVSGPGGTSTEGFARRLRKALADPDIGGIVIDVESPGGTVDGVPELADELFAARGQKPIVAVANTLAGSAAYWVASQAPELVVSPSAEVGSIGVWAMHEDISARLEAEGVSVSLIHAGKFKVEGNPFEPLGEGARDFLQGRVDETHDQFIAAVARGRGVERDRVANGFGEGRMVGADAAVAMGMADRVDTIDNVIAQMQADLADAAPASTARRSRISKYDFAFR